MRKLLVVVPAILAFALILGACGGGNTSNTLQRVVIPLEDVRSSYNVEGGWYRHEGSTREKFVTFNYHERRPFSGGSRFIEAKKGIRLKLDSEASLVRAGALYGGIDLFYKEWDGKGVLPFVKTFTSEAGKKYQIHLVTAYVGIKDPAGLKPGAPKQTTPYANQAYLNET